MFLTRKPLWPNSLGLNSAACIACQWRTFSTSYRRLAEKKRKETKILITQPLLENAPRADGKAVEEFTPKPLNRPIGLPTPPRAGENTGIDARTWKQRWEDYLNYDKHLIRRKEITKKFARSYFRDWSNMRLHKGKSFLAPPRLFKAEFAQYFPNFHGQTLIKDKKMRDTTTVLEDKISIVSVYNTDWALRQANTFVLEKNNPELLEIVRSSSEAQMVQINIEENPLKHSLIRLFMPSLRKKTEEHSWGRYFVVKNNISEESRDAIGYLNSKVGYTYLVDGKCRIRWAGSGPAEGNEKQGLVAGVKRLLEEMKTKKTETLSQPPTPTAKKTTNSKA